MKKLLLLFLLFSMTGLASPSYSWLYYLNDQNLELAGKTVFYLGCAEFDNEYEYEKRFAEKSGQLLGLFEKALPTGTTYAQYYKELAAGFAGFTGASDGENYVGKPSPNPRKYVIPFLLISETGNIEPGVKVAIYAPSSYLTLEGEKSYQYRIDFSERKEVATLKLNKDKAFGARYRLDFAGDDFVGRTLFEIGSVSGDKESTFEYCSMVASKLACEKLLPESPMGFLRFADYYSTLAGGMERAPIDAKTEMFLFKPFGDGEMTPCKLPVFMFCSAAGPVPGAKVELYTTSGLLELGSGLNFQYDAGVDSDLVPLLIEIGGEKTNEIELKKDSEYEFKYSLKNNDKALAGRTVYDFAFVKTVSADDRAYEDAIKEASALIEDKILKLDKNYETYKKYYDYLSYECLEHGCIGDDSGVNLFAPNFDDSPCGVAVLLVPEGGSLTPGGRVDCYVSKNVLSLAHLEDADKCQYELVYGGDDSNLTLYEQITLREDAPEIKYEHLLLFEDVNLEFKGRKVICFDNIRDTWNNTEKIKELVEDTFTFYGPMIFPTEESIRKFGCQNYAEFWEFMNFLAQDQLADQIDRISESGQNYIFKPFSHFLTEEPYFATGLLFLSADKFEPGAYFELYFFNKLVRLNQDSDKYMFKVTPEDLELNCQGYLKSDTPEPFCGALVLGLAALAFGRRRSF